MKRKWNFDIKGFFNKKENAAIIAVAAVFCAGLIVTEMKAGDIPLHDGDVLVDSRNIAQAEVDADESASEQKEKGAEQKASGDTETAGDIFAGKRASLELERSGLIAQFDDTIKNSTNDAEKKNAVAQKEKLTKYMEQELAVESILATKNLPDCMVIITESTVTVTVDEVDLKQNTAAKICSTVMEETGRTADKIIIQSNY